MSLVVATLWNTANETTRAELITLARQGDALIAAQGGGATMPPASNLAVTSPAATVEQWADSYAARQAATVGTMPLSVLWGGSSAWDPRADAIVGTIYNFLTQQGTPPPWREVLERLRPATQAVRMNADWFAARGPQLQAGDAPNRTMDNLQRGWWWAYAQTLRPVAATDPAVGSYPVTPTPGTNPPPGSGLPGATSTTSGGTLLLVAAAAAAVLFLRRR